MQLWSGLLKSSGLGVGRYVPVVDFFTRTYEGLLCREEARDPVPWHAVLLVYVCPHRKCSCDPPSAFPLVWGSTDRYHCCTFFLHVETYFWCGIVPCSHRKVSYPSMWTFSLAYALMENAAVIRLAQILWSGGRSICTSGGLLHSYLWGPIV